MIGNYLIGCLPLASISQDDEGLGVNVWRIVCKNPSDVWEDLPKNNTSSRECETSTQCL